MKFRLNSVFDIPTIFSDIDCLAALPVNLAFVLSLLLWTICMYNALSSQPSFVLFLSTFECY